MSASSSTTSMRSIRGDASRPLTTHPSPVMSTRPRSADRQRDPDPPPKSHLHELNSYRYQKPVVRGRNRVFLADLFLGVFIRHSLCSGLNLKSVLASPRPPDRIPMVNMIDSGHEIRLALATGTFGLFAPKHERRYFQNTSTR